MTAPPPRPDRARSDALVFFGATGDLAYKKIFPALQAMARRGRRGTRSGGRRGQRVRGRAALGRRRPD
jgi:hypothetical protein